MYLTQAERENPGRERNPWERPALASCEVRPAEGCGLGPMVGRSLAMQYLFARMRCTATHFHLATVEGEAGTGKLLAAQTLHRMGPAAAGPFVPCAAEEFLDCPALSWKGNGQGLVYLAGVDELSGEGQRELRDLLRRMAREQMTSHVVARPLQLVAGARQPLRRLAASGAFRPDLVSHLTAIRFALPSLRERREDIPLLAALFLRRWSERQRKSLRGFAPASMEALVRYPWPGNVRELEAAVSAAALECAGPWVEPRDLPLLDATIPVEAVGREEEQGEDSNLDQAILRHVTRVLAKTGGNKVRAARMLGISRSTLYRLLESGATPAGPARP